MRLTTLLAVAFLSPSIALAAASDSAKPPKPTQTSADCIKGQVFDTKTKTCLDAKSENHSDDTRYNAVRELAYSGQYDRALLVLAAMSDQSQSRVLTYYGFINRKMGNMVKGMEFYTAALEADADNILARSYMGQALVQLGQQQAASMQLAEIQSRNGRGTWAEASLKLAIKTGKTFSY